MAGTKTSRAELKSHFQKGDYPTENDFANVFESFVHKDDDISASKVSISDSEGNRTSISTLIDRKADKSIVSAHDKRLDDAEKDIADNALDIQATERTAYKILAILGKKEDESIDAFVARINALGTDYSTFATLAEKLRDFLDGTSDVDGTINKWQEIETFLQGITETDSLAEMLGQMQRTIEEQIPQAGDYLPMTSTLDNADKRYPCVDATNGHIYICKGEQGTIHEGDIYYIVGANDLGLPTGRYFSTGELKQFALSKPDPSHHYHYPLPIEIGDIGCRYSDDCKFTITAFDASSVTMQNSDGIIVTVPNVDSGGGANDVYRHETEDYEITDPWLDWLYVKKAGGHWEFVKSYQPRNETFITKTPAEEDIILGGWQDVYDGEIANKYERPSDGIPKADLSTSVQTSLGKADTALQLIEHGTDGQYISTTISAKASNKQSVSSALTIQPVETADIVKKGVAEAFNVKNYVDGKVQNLAEQIYDETVFAYGVEWSLTSGSPECTRLGNPYYHKVLPIHSRMVGGLMTDDGTFTPFKNQSDWTTETRDGSAGQVMVEIPEFYIKYVTLSDRLQVWMSERPLYGYQKVDKMYIGAYEATVQRSTNKLCSVVNTTTDYRGGNDNASWDSENTAGQDGESHRSLLGRPATSISLTQCRTMARNRNNGDTRWNCKPYEAQKIIYWLYVVEYATLNSQKAYNSQKSAEGFAQGGLGEGITTWDGNSWNNYNGYYPFVPCGYTDHLGNRTGTRDYTIHNSSGGVLKAFLASQGSGAIRYRGIENPFGHIWEWTDGVLVNVTASTSPVYVCKYPSLYSSTDFSHYDYIGDEMRVEQFLREIHFGENGDITAKSGAGSSNTFYCDYHYANVSSPNLRGLLWGGDAFYGARAGLVCSLSHNVPSITYPHVGSRLCFKA
ncbi:MAG: hypothetical protein MJZ66_02750 [Bacteroidales bacterium]|nr:hypothetical protein [Bacteroidales bacterium]